MAQAVIDGVDALQQGAEMVCAAPAAMYEMTCAYVSRFMNQVLGAVQRQLLAISQSAHRSLTYSTTTETEEPRHTTTTTTKSQGYFAWIPGFYSPQRHVPTPKDGDDDKALKCN